MLNLLKKVVCWLLLLSCVFAGSAVAETARASHQAWSSYWWPYVYGGLATGYDYRNNPAPLEKYELLTDGFLSGRLTYPYRQSYYDADAPSWYGLCYAWASASTFEPEPANPSVHDNILFRVGDKKGLLTLAHTADQNLTATSDQPVNFHNWLIEIIGQRQQMFYADLDPGEEVWSYPIYAYDMTYGPRIGDQQSVEVTISYADDFVGRDFVGTQVQHHYYTYVLNYDAQGHIVSGQWTGSSVGDHPARLTYVEKQGTSAAASGLDIALLRTLGAAVDDEWETPGTVALPPGSYQMISLNQDRYLLSGYEGDSLSLRVEKMAGPENPLYIRISDLQGIDLDSTTLTQAGERLEWTLSGSANGAYILSIDRDASADADFYQLDFDRHSLDEQMVFPYVPANGWWSGFALTNLSSEPVKGVVLTSLDFDGRSLETHLDLDSLSAGSKVVTTFSALPSRQHEKSQRQTLVLNAPHQIAAMNLFGGSEDGLGGFFSGVAPVARIQLPFSSASWSELTWGGVINRSDVAQTLQCSVYGADGYLLGHDVVILEPQQKIRLSSIAAVSNLPSGGWLDLAVESGDDCLSAYQLWRSLSDSTKLEAIRGLVPASTFWLAHVEDAGIWSTDIVVINPASTPLNLTFTLPLHGVDAATVSQLSLAPHERRVVALRDLFPDHLDKLYQSAVRIDGAHDFSAYVTYNSNEDLAAVPLQQEGQLSDRLALPHFSVTDSWWTGIALFNPMDEAVEVTMVPVGLDGQPMIEQTKIMTLASGGKSAFSLLQYWPLDTARLMSHIEISVPQDQKIGGLFLLGRYGTRQLVGSLLAKIPD